MAGTVVDISARQGQTLNADQQAPIILRIAELDTTMWLLKRRNRRRARPGAPAAAPCSRAPPAQPWHDRPESACGRSTQTVRRARRAAPRGCEDD